MNGCNRARVYMLCFAYCAVHVCRSVPLPCNMTLCALLRAVYMSVHSGKQKADNYIITFTLTSIIKPSSLSSPSPPPPLLSLSMSLPLLLRLGIEDDLTLGI